MTSTTPPATARWTALTAQIDYLERLVARESPADRPEAGPAPRPTKGAVNWRRSLLRSRALIWLSAPVIWSCLLPIALLDLFGTVYQAICFPIYGIPKVRRGDYLAFDRHLLDYLGVADKANCEYCAYANGILGYFTEIAGRTEQYWCPIKHEHAVAAAHRRYGAFLEFGDAQQYRERLARVRHAFDDVAGPHPASPIPAPRNQS